MGLGYSQPAKEQETQTTCKLPSDQGQQVPLPPAQAQKSTKAFLTPAGCALPQGMGIQNPL